MDVDTVVSAPESGGLHIGGLPSAMQFGAKNSGVAKTVQGFVGTIKDLVFIDDRFVIYALYKKLDNKCAPSSIGLCEWLP
jgi:hypothetical protein